jgi:hypothetical protein
MSTTLRLADLVCSGDVTYVAHSKLLSAFASDDVLKLKSSEVKLEAMRASEVVAISGELELRVGSYLLENQLVCIKLLDASLPIMSWFIA